MQRFTTKSKSKSSAEQQISCPICTKLVPFSSINSHLDLCSQRPSTSSQAKSTVTTTNNTSSDEKKSISSILHVYSKGKRKRGDEERSDNEIEKDTIIVALEEGPEQIKDEFPRDIKKQKSQTNSSGSGTGTADIKYLQKISHLPLSEKLRPKTLLEYVGQQHILSQENGALTKYIQQGMIPSMILWGPPGVGKTSLARLMTKAASNAFFMVETSATKANTQELRSIFEKSKAEYKLTKRRTILFIDEIHRFNKPQQDLLLPHVENGDVILIGATTENPSFQLNNALISRCHVFVLEKLNINETIIVLSRGIALLNKLRKFVWNIPRPLKVSREALEYISDLAIGDTRRALNLLEMVEVSTRVAKKEDSNEAGKDQNGVTEQNEPFTSDAVREIIKNSSSDGLSSYYDTKGDNHYDTISAFHKAVRGSDENASLYYLARMMKGGEDPLYIARRMIRIASEDIGTRDNTLLPLAIAAHDAVMKIGLPEADLALVHCCVALARAPKSVEIYRAWGRVKSMINENKYSMASSEIPMHIRNAPTKLMEELGYSKGYKYNPTYKDGKCKQQYFPQEVLDKCEDPKKDLKFLTGKHLGDKIDPDLCM